MFGSGASARELIHLKSGFTIEAISHLLEGDLITVSASAGSLQFLRTEVLNIEQVPQLNEPEAVKVAPVANLKKAPQILITEAAFRQGLPADFVASVAAVESGLNSSAVSRKGAVGLMQLMPATASELGVSAQDAGSNVEGGARYLRQLLVQYHGNSVLALAAYNAGPGTVARFGGVPPYPETLAYIGRVLKAYSQRSKPATGHGTRHGEGRSPQ